jgi:hypothetical protein
MGRFESKYSPIQEAKRPSEKREQEKLCRYEHAEPSEGRHVTSNQVTTQISDCTIGGFVNDVSGCKYSQRATSTPIYHLYLLRRFHFYNFNNKSLRSGQPRLKFWNGIHTFISSAAWRLDSKTSS